MASTVAHVIPTMDHINAVLRCTGPTALNPSVKAALEFACKCLDKYYSKTDLSNVYRIAMGVWSFRIDWISHTIHSSPSSNETKILYATWMGQGGDSRRNHMG